MFVKRNKWINFFLSSFFHLLTDGKKYEYKKHLCAWHADEDEADEVLEMDVNEREIKVIVDCWWVVNCYVRLHDISDIDRLTKKQKKSTSALINCEFH